MSAELPESAIAIVGMAGRVPGARSVDEFWQNVRNGVESIRTLSDEELIAAGVEPAALRDPLYVKAGGPLDDVRMFDAGFFGVSPKEAAIMDPQHRHFLECAVTALEHAGHAPRSFRGAIGVFAGCGMNSYFIHNILSNPDLLRSEGLFLLRHTGNDRDFLATTLSYKLDLRGPSMAVQTACSTSLVAVHMACQSLLSGECDMALAGGVTILVPHGHGYYYREKEPVSPDGHCRPFDANAAGTVISSGAGVVVLRRLADALESGDTIHAVVRGSAVNNDGAGKIGYLAPSVDGHARAVTEALAVAGLDADEIDYVEAHGTGTPVGDPIEIAALTQAFRKTTDRQQFCAIGSVKSNLGHLDTAAGVTSLIKVARALEAREMPPSLHFSAPNPQIDFASSPFRVNSELRPWVTDGRPRRAGVSSLGIGGTNVHVVLEEAPRAANGDAPARSLQLLPLSAKSTGALDAATANLGAWLGRNPSASLADVAFTLQEGREPHDLRRVVVADTSAGAAAALAAKAAPQVYTGRREGGRPSVIFLFSGAGAQYPGMARELYASEPVFRRELDRCLAALRTMVDFDLTKWLHPSASDVDEARRQLELPSRQLPAIFATEWALAQTWRSWGIEPAGAIGHSMGEYAAACLAGVLSLEDALRIVVLRGALVDRMSGGAMLSMLLPEADARREIGDELDLAAVNAPSLCVASGAAERVQRLHEALTARGIEARMVPINAAGHSRRLDPILAEFRRGIGKVRLAAPALPFVSNVTGTWIRPEEACDPDYWVRHFRNTVRFSDGLAEILREPDRVLLEVGPGQSLSAFARQQPKKARAIVASLRRPSEEISDVQVLLGGLGQLWCAGVPVPWSKLRGPAERRRRIPLPTYPFEHKQPYWIEPRKRAEAAPEEQPLTRHASLAAWFHQPVWRKAPILPGGAEQPPERWLVFLDRAGLGTSIAARLRDAGHDVVTVREGDTFYRFGEREFALAPEAGRDGYDQLIGALAASNLLPQRVAHLWSVSAGSEVRPGSSLLHRNQECGFYSLLFLAQALGDSAPDQLPRHIAAISSGMQAVEAGEIAAFPEKATLLGPVRVIPHEFAGVRCQSIDLVLPTKEGASRRAAPSPSLDDLARCVLAELRAESPAPVVAWRGTERFEERIEPAGGAETADGAIGFRTGGTYLVTGGLGGIGFALAERLARAHQAKLILVGRGGLPPEERWDAWLASHGERDRTSRRIASIRELRRRGAEIAIASADVADVERMREVIAEAKDRFGALHGVLHAAGTLEDGLIQMRSQEAVERVFTPKLHGTMVLDSLLRDEPLDFFAVFSSVSALLGPPGQVDYVAANCFLNAFAARRTALGRRTIAIDWAVWNEVGGAADVSHRLRHEPGEIALSRLTGNALLGECVEDGPERWRWEARYRSRALWVLDDHRGPDGVAIMPGTGFIALAHAAWRDAFGSQPCEIQDALFAAPLLVRDDEEVPVAIELARKGDGFTLEVHRARSSEALFRATLRAPRRSELAPLPVASIAARCAREMQEAPVGQTLRTSQETLLGFGPRWATLRRLQLGDGEALATLELAPALEGDLDAHALHAGLLDVATGCALPLLPGWRAGEALFVPLTYSSIRVRAPLTRALVSHVRSRPGNRFDGEVAVFDVTIADPDGAVLVEIEGYQMRRLRSSEALGAAVTPRAAAGHTSEGAESRAAPTPAERVFLETFEHGIRLDEGFEALRRAVAQPSSVVVVSPIDLARWRERLERASAAETAAPSVRFERPELESDYVGPRDELEKKLAGWWEELLGVDRIGVHDDFFGLGGHSLIAVRLFARIKKEWEVDWPISLLFEAPTVERIAERLREEVGPLDGESRPKEARGPQHRFLVAMNRVGATSKHPFFLVSGMFGNVLNLRHLAAHLGHDQPVYALQAKGLYGEDEPHRRFEDMARDYLTEIRSLQPEGPYILGGFSGGGLTAFEMAHQLLAIGEDVAALILLDSWPPPRLCPAPSTFDRLVIHTQRLARRGPSYLLEWSKRRAQWRAEQRERVRNPLAREQTPAEFRSEQIEAAFREALTHYEMRAFPGKIFLFRPPLDTSHRLLGGRVASVERVLVEHRNWWSPWVEGGIDVQVVPGNHDSMVLEPNVRVLASRVRAVLEECQRAKSKDAPS